MAHALARSVGRETFLSDRYGNLPGTHCYKAVSIDRVEKSAVVVRDGGGNGGSGREWSRAVAAVDDRRDYTSNVPKSLPD